MSIEDLPDGFVLPTRAEVRDKYQRDVALRQPGAPTGQGSQAFIEGSVLADMLMPIYANAASIARGANLEDMTREQLMAKCRAMGLPEELPASAGTGFVVITASAGGVFINETRFIKDEQRGVTFRCARADTYINGQAVPIIGVDTGPNTNVPADTTLKWTNPPPGLGVVATVQADANGDGTTGGRDAESDDDIRRRISDALANPPAGGNVAHVRDLVKEGGRVLGIAVQDVFVFPAILGPGTYCYVFTIRTGNPGDSRAPTSTQIAAMRAYVHRALPEDDGIFAGEVNDEEVEIDLGVTWAADAEGWLDAVQWPVYSAAWEVETVTSALAFRVKAMAGGTPAVPQVGQTIAFYDADERKFARKRILTATVVSATQYDLTIDDTNNSSDPTYKPVVGERFCPYSPSLDLLVEPLLTELDTLGPGEQIEEPFDEGYRQRRLPENPLEWPSAIRHVHLDSVDDLPQVHDVEWFAPDIPYTPSVGTPGATVNLVHVASILAFPS